ncbi:MAG: glycosyltransferase [Microgenomates group bacterium]
MTTKQLLSVIVPAYKQEKTIVKDLQQIELVLKQLRYDYEIICVVDGKVDKTFEKAKKISSSKLKVIGYEENHGKGYAVRYGMARAKGDLIAFIDAGMDINPKALPMLLEHMIWYDSDIIVGSIRHSASKVIGYPLKRKIYSVGYHWLTRILFGLRITDSQRGVKIFKRKVLERTLPRLLVKNFAFDIEILSVAHRLGFKRIHDGPVEMDARKFRYSSIKSSTVFSMLIDTLAIFYRLKILHYYDRKKRKIKNQSLSLSAVSINE